MVPPKKYNKAMDDFSAIKVSTQTYIIHSNLDKVDLSSILKHISLDIPYEDIPDSYEDDDDYDGITFPRLISVSYKKEERGKSKKKKVPTKLGKNFLNCVSMTVQLDPKKSINVKLFNNGVLQLTGCKCYDHAQNSLIIIWNALEKIPDFYKFKEHTGFSETHMEAYIVSAMRNVDFRIGFEIDREALGIHIAKNTEYKTAQILQGFMGVQISIPIESVEDMLIHKITFHPEFKDEIIKYGELWKIKPSVQVKANKPKSVTISVFQSGQVLLSGIDEMYQEPVFKWFVNEIDSIQDKIKIKTVQEKNFIDFIPKKRRSKFQFKTIFE